MESWRLVWRDGFEAVLSNAALVALADGLRRDDPRITQGSTVTPPFLVAFRDWPVEAACCLGYAGWQGESLDTVGEVEEFFARACFEAEQRLGEPGSCRWLLNWFDDTPRHQMRRDLLGEVERTIRGRSYLELVAEEIGLIPAAPWWIVADKLFDEGRDAEAERIKALYGPEVAA